MRRLTIPQSKALSWLRSGEWMPWYGLQGEPTANTLMALVRRRLALRTGKQGWATGYQITPTGRSLLNQEKEGQ